MQELLHASYKRFRLKTFQSYFAQVLNIFEIKNGFRTISCRCKRQNSRSVREEREVITLHKIQIYYSDKIQYRAQSEQINGFIHEKSEV